MAWRSSRRWAPAPEPPSAGSPGRTVLFWAAAGLLALAGLALLRVWVPSEDPRAAICFARRTLGIPCPGCGMTRAFAHLAKGEWRQAVADHPLAPLIAVELALGWLIWGAAALGRIPARLPPWLADLLLAHAAALCALWLGRLATGTLP